MQCVMAQVYGFELANAKEVRAALKEQGLSLAAWARAEGEDPKRVARVVREWAGRWHGKPRGVATRRILRALGETVGLRLCRAVAVPVELYELAHLFSGDALTTDMGLQLCRAIPKGLV